MSLSNSKIIGEIVAETPAAARVFERLGIDYVCGGKHPIGEVCERKGLGLEELSAEIELAARMEIPTETRDWNTAPLAEVIRHILVTHHLYLENALPAMDRLVTRIADLDGDRFPELAPPLKKIFQQMEQDLTAHLREEETVQFPAIIQMEKMGGCAGAMPDGPLTRLEHDHDEAGRALEEMRGITNNFTPPPGANRNLRTLYRELKVFESDMVRHLHIENNILFARANRRAASLNEAIHP